MISAAQLLDELMGSDRNLAPDQKGKSIHWSDSQVCRYFLCGFCPSELFINTRSDLGPCEKLHDEKLRTAYEKSNRYGLMGYEEEFLRYLQNIMTDVERRIRRGHARLIPKGDGAPSNKPDNEKERMLTEKINALVDQVETLGCEGKVEEAQGVMKLIDQLKDEREQIKGPSRDMNNLMSSQEKQMEVCEVCGAFLIVGDAQTRVDDHLMGKQHMGYAKIKSTLEEMKTRPWRNKKSPDSIMKEEEAPAKEHEERDSGRDRRESRDRDRDMDKDRKDRDRDQDRDRTRDRDRRDRDRRGRDRGDRDRDRSDRDRDRSDRDRDRSDRDRDRGDRDRGGRDRDRDRDRRRSDRDRDRDSDRERRKDKERDRDSKEGDRDSKERDRDSKEPSQEVEVEKEDSKGNDKDKSRRSRSRSRERTSRDRESSRDRRRSRSRSPRRSGSPH